MWIFHRCHERDTFYWTWHLFFQNSLRKRIWSFALGIVRKNGGWWDLGSTDTTSPTPQIWNIVCRNEYRRMTAVSCARLVWNRVSCSVYSCTQSLAQEGLDENNIGHTCVDLELALHGNVNGCCVRPTEIDARIWTVTRTLLWLDIRSPVYSSDEVSGLQLQIEPYAHNERRNICHIEIHAVIPCVCQVIPQNITRYGACLHQGVIYLCVVR